MWQQYIILALALASMLLGYQHLKNCSKILAFLKLMTSTYKGELLALVSPPPKYKGEQSHVLLKLLFSSFSLQIPV